METYNLGDHFKDKDKIVREIYNRLLASLKKIGPIKEGVKKSSIHLKSKASFGGVHPHQSFINLIIRTNYDIDSPRVARTEQLSKNRFHHAVKLQAVDDVDDELLGWLKDAYKLSA